jgi:AcrR family transcriptional regulator
MARTEDRRVQRPARALQEALMALIVEKGYARVTVQDIIDRADVGRATFYAHFLNTRQLLESGFERLRADLAPPQATAGTTGGSPGERALGFSLPLFRHAQGHHQLYKALLGPRSGEALGVVREQIEHLLGEALRANLAALAPRAPRPAVPREVTVQFVVGALYELLTWWLDRDMPYPPEQMDRFFKQLTAPSVDAALGHAAGTARP